MTEHQNTEPQHDAGAGTSPDHTSEVPPAPPSRKRLREADTTRPAVARKRLLIIGGGVLLLVAVLVAVLWPRNGVERVTVAGVEFRTNVVMEEYNNSPYANIPINSDTQQVVIETENPRDTATIREFLDAVNTFVPGEYTLQLADRTMYVRVDGIAE